MRSGHLHPDLVGRLTQEATKSADHVLRMCIRALDYLPPVDVRFGEFLRAIITADTDLIPDDRLNYRLAFVQAFRRRGIFPENCLSMSPDNLLWNMAPQDPDDPEFLSISDVQNEGLDLVPHYRRSDIVRTSEDNRRKIWYWLTQPELILKAATPAEKARFDALRSRARAMFSGELGRRRGKQLDAFVDEIQPELEWLGVTPEGFAALGEALRAARTHFERWKAFLTCLYNAGRVFADAAVDRRWEKVLGVYFQRPDGNPLYTIGGDSFGLKIEVASVRTTRRSGPDGQDIRQLVIEVTQRRQGYFDTERQKWFDATPVPARKGPPRGDFVFRGGATLIVDLRDNKLRYVISKRIDDDDRLERQREQLLFASTMGFTYDRGRSLEPFALLHRM